MKHHTQRDYRSRPLCGNVSPIGGGLRARVARGVSADLSKIAPPLEAAECSDAMLPRFSPRFDACQPCTASRAYHRKRRSAGKMVSLTYPHDREIVAYCACPNEASAAIAVKHLKQAGFRKIRPLLGGIDAWVQAGQPLEHAPQ